MELTKDKLTIQEAAAATGLSAHTLRYYERIGFIHPISREETTRRCYRADDIGWIAFLTKLRATGMSIREMQKYAELQENLKLVHYKIEIYGQMIEEKEIEKS